MIFSSKATSQAPGAALPCTVPVGEALNPPRGGRGLAAIRKVVGFRFALPGALCLALLSACGGSTSQLDPFVPQRLVVFGDETSTLEQSGRKYSVNGLAANGTLDCASEPLWVQSLAALYHFEFAECNPSAVEPQALMRAFAGARVADVAAQVEAQVAAGGFRERDLATVLAGTNDILDLYVQYPGRSVDSLVAEAGQRGATLALVVNRLVGLGVKVIVSDLPDMGLSPYAQAQKALDFTGLDRAALITQLGQAFSEQLGVKVVLDGRYVGLVQAQLRFKSIGVSPGGFGLSNISSGVCTVALPNCTIGTLVAGGASTQYLWADDTRLSTGGQSQLATLAIDRARRNPF
jgi:lysophospholipase L1-like esterase